DGERVDAEDDRDRHRAEAPRRLIDGVERCRRARAGEERDDDRRLQEEGGAHGHSFIPFALTPQRSDPPSTGIVAPVIHRARSDAKNATTLATSSGWPRRFRACMSIAFARPPSVLRKLAMSVSMKPGATALTRMPRAPSGPAT